MNFSEKLQVLRKTKSLTQEELAEKLDVSRQAVAKWESGISYPDILNLIQLSDIFHTTVDYLVKDGTCEKALVKSDMEKDLLQLIEFKMESLKNTYAGDLNSVPSSRLESHDYSYSKGDYKYYDSWLGGEKFSGEEAVWKNDKPVFSMNYFGRVTDERFSGDFLHEVLRNATVEMPYRGPELYQAGDFTYKTKCLGDITWFQGFEEIFFQNNKVYECYYHGGVL